MLVRAIGNGFVKRRVVVPHGSNLVVRGFRTAASRSGMMASDLFTGQSVLSAQSSSVVSHRSHLPHLSGYAVPKRGFASLPPHNVITMPALSPTMTKGNVANWMKKEGDKVGAGEVLCEIETDKATVALEAQDDGYLAKILIPKGTADVPIGEPLLVMTEKKDAVGTFKDFKPASSGSKPVPPADSSKPATKPPTPAPPHTAAPAPDAPSSGSRVMASPLAKVLAAEKGVDLRSVAGTGPEGRIVKADVLSAAVTPAARTPSTAIVSEQYTDLPLSNIRRVIAQRLSQSKQEIPHYYLTIDAKLDKLLRLRQELNTPRAGEKDVSVKLSINDFIIKAAALACKKVPEANSSWQEQFVRRYVNVDINVAVATDQGLLTPVIRDADRIGLAAIAGTVRTLADKAKVGKLTPSDLQIGTFTISNLGMFGVKQFAAVILPPQSCIMAVGNIEKRLELNESATQQQQQQQQQHLSTSSHMSFTLSCDHRVVDGAVGAQWLQAFRELIEDPVRMLL